MDSIILTNPQASKNKGLTNNNSAIRIFALILVILRIRHREKLLVNRLY